MNRSTQLGAAGALAAVLSVAAASSSGAVAPTTSHESATYPVVLTCAEGDDVDGQFTYNTVVREYSDGTTRLHLRVGGTLSRPSTGGTARYAETQVDVFLNDGSESYAGLFSHLIVQGGKGFRVAGRVQFDSEGNVSGTPGTAMLLGDPDAFADNVCSALS